MRELYHLDSNQIHFNSASMGPLMKAGYNRSKELLETLIDPRYHNLTFFSELYQNAAQDMASFLNAPVGQVGHAVSPSYALTTIISSFAFASDDICMTFDQEYSSNFLTLQAAAKEKRFQLRVISSKAGVIDFDHVIEEIGPRTRMVVISWAQFLTGQLAPLDRLSERCRETGTFLIVDGSQAVGSAPIDLAQTPVDALYGSSHKWLGGLPGASYFYLSEELQRRIGPLVHSGINYENGIGLGVKTGGPSPQMSRFAAGTTDPIPYVSLGENMKALGAIDLPQGFARSRALKTRARDILLDKGAEVIGHAEAGEWMPTFSFRLEQSDLFRDFLMSKKILFSEREGCFRLAFHLFNSSDEVEQLDQYLNSQS